MSSEAEKLEGIEADILRLRKELESLYQKRKELLAIIPKKESRPKVNERYFDAHQRALERLLRGETMSKLAREFDLSPTRMRWRLWAHSHLLLKMPGHPYHQLAMDYSMNLKELRLRARELKLID